MRTLLQDARTSATTLRDDNRGAVMLTGLFMSFFLVGALWYVIGIGDAIIFRDRMQEAADAAVFSSAAVHAKGMNFISVCNILLLLMAMVHIVAGLVQDATIAACLSIWLSVVACPRVPFAVKAFHNTSGAMKTLMTATANASTAIALAAPWAGTARGYTIGNDYGKQGRVNDVTVIAMGQSNFPGMVGGSGMLLGVSPPVGLPVKGEQFNMLCERIGSKLVSFLLSAAPIPWKSKIQKFLGGAAGFLLKLRYCNAMGSGIDGTGNMVQEVRDQLGKVKDEMETGANQSQSDIDNGGTGTKPPPPSDYNPSDPEWNDNLNGGRRDDSKKVNGWKKWFDPGFDRGWGDPGVLVVDDAAGNGTQAHSVWSLNLNPKYLETNERRVSVAGSIGKDGKPVVADAEAKSTMIGYFAQAEFYYDCTKEWGDDDCNGDNNASFGINWRARLRGLQVPNLWNLVGRIVNGGIAGAVGKALGAIGNNPVAKALVRTVAGAVTIDALSDYIKGKVGQYFTGPVTNQVTDYFDGLQPTLTGSYH